MADGATIVQWGAVAAFVFLTCWAMLSDLRHLLIDNWVSIALGVLFLPGAWAMSMPWDQVGWHYATGAGFLIGGFALFALRIIGGGDVKFAAATAVWLGPSLVAGFLFLFAVLGGVLAAVALIGRGVALPAPLAALPWLGKGAEAGIPYGIAIGLAGLYGLTRTPIGRPLGALIGL